MQTASPCCYTPVDAHAWGGQPRAKSEWVCATSELVSSPHRRSKRLGRSSSEMRTIRFRNPNIRPRIGPARSSDGAFFRAIFVLGIAVLFVVAAVLVWRWAITEAELAAPPPKADQVSKDEGSY
jgi:hypothetical protein